METKSEVARQIHVLLLGLAQRARRAGLSGLAADLSAVAKKAEREGAKPKNQPDND